MKSYDYVEMYKVKNNLSSDYMVAGNLQVTRQAMSNYKNGRPLDEVLAMRIADNLGISQGEIFAVIAAERCRTPVARKALLKLAKLSKEAGWAATKLLITIPFLAFLVQYIVYYVK